MKEILKNKIASANTMRELDKVTDDLIRYNEKELYDLWEERRAAIESGGLQTNMKFE